MKVLGVIPARGGSREIPRKNIVLLAGRPLIAWTIEAARRSGIARAVVSTDDAEIARIAAAEQGDVPFLRPGDLAGDSAPIIPVLVHALTECEKADGEYEAVMLLQPTSPMRIPGDIDRAIATLAGSPPADSVISVVPVGGNHPARMKYIEDGWLVDPEFCEETENRPRAELRPMFIRNGAIYLTRRETLVARGSLKGRRSLAMVMPAVRSVNIDSALDLRLAGLLMSEPGWQSR